MAYDSHIMHSLLSLCCVGASANNDMHVSPDARSRFHRWDDGGRQLMRSHCGYSATSRPTIHCCQETNNVVTGHWLSLTHAVMPPCVA